MANYDRASAKRRIIEAWAPHWPTPQPDPNGKTRSVEADIGYNLKCMGQPLRVCTQDEQLETFAQALDAGTLTPTFVNDAGETKLVRHLSGKMARRLQAGKTRNRPEPVRKDDGPAPTSLEGMVRHIAENTTLELLADFEASNIDEAKLKSLIDEALKGLPPMRLVTPAGPKDLPKLRHEVFDDVLAVSSWAATKNIMLVGPAGTGKTTIAAQLAEALGKRFAFISCSAGTSEGKVLGRLLPVGVNGKWAYVPAEFVNIYRNGGVFLFDEVDAADANLMVVINAALANGKMAIPSDGETPTHIERHPDCIIIAAANTFGMGADRQYVGRNQLDAATLDRFVGKVFDTDYSPTIETALAKAYGDAGIKAAKWAWTLRSKVRAHKLRRVVSTRALVEYATALQASDGDGFVNRFYNGWAAEERTKVGAPKIAKAVDWKALAASL